MAENSLQNQNLPQKSNKLNTLAFLEVGGAEIFFVLLILILFFGILNYFNILSLSNIYPHQLGFLPHQALNTNTKPTPNQFPALNSNFSTLATNQASNGQINKYKVNVLSFKFGGPETDPKSNISTVEGIFSGYTPNSLQIVTSEGVLTFNITGITVYEKMGLSDNSVGSASAVLGILNKYTFDQFKVNVSLGKVLQITYNQNKTGINATTIDYMSGYNKQ